MSTGYGDVSFTVYFKNDTQASFTTDTWMIEHVVEALSSEGSKNSLAPLYIGGKTVLVNLEQVTHIVVEY